MAGYAPSLVNSILMKIDIHQTIRMANRSAQSSELRPKLDSAVAPYVAPLVDLVTQPQN